MIRRTKIAVSVAVLAGALLTYAVVMAQGGAPSVPHPVEGQENCSGCHTSAALPASHEGRAQETCLFCHAPAAPTPAATPSPAPAIAPPVDTPAPSITPTPTTSSVPTATAAPVPTRAPTGTPADAAQVPAPSPPPTASATRIPAASTPSPTVTTGAGGGAVETGIEAPPASLAAPEVPHSLDGREKCLECHAEGGVRSFPVDHEGRADQTCLACHQAGEPEAIVAAPVVEPTSALSSGAEAAACVACHGDPGLSKVLPDGREVSLYVDEDAVRDSAHANLGCATCHRGDPHADDSLLNKASLAASCGTCHVDEYELHLDSIHGQQLPPGNPDAASCVDCHSADRTPHSVVRIWDQGAPTYKKNIAETCGQCHRDEGLMAGYGGVEKVYETYMRSFHGKALQLAGDDASHLEAATCTNCHGTHDIRRPDDPDSPLAGMENLARTCGECHEGATAEFASSFPGHKEVSPENAPAAFYTEKFFLVLTAGVSGLGVAVVVLASIHWGLRGWKEKHEGTSGEE